MPVLDSTFRLIRYGVALLVFMVLQLQAIAQQPQADTANKIRVVIANSGVFEYFKTDSGSYNKFVTDVVLYQGTDTLYCDSLYQYIESKKLEAFGAVRVAQMGGTEATCSYLRYTSDKRVAYMTGNVTLTDGKNRLWCEELTYDLATKNGSYNRHGTLQSDSTTVTSTSGTYNVNTHESRFIGNVVVTDPQYKITSKELGYNTETKMQTFYDYSVVTSDSGKSILSTWRGTYDTKNVIARFTGHSSIWNDGQYIEADSMHYDKISGYGYAIGNVISIDTAQHATIYCGRADFFRKKRVLWAILKPVVELATGKDTFYMRADTFYSAPMIRVPGKAFVMPIDTAGIIKDTTQVSALPPSPADSIMAATAKVHADTSSAHVMGKGRKKKAVADTVAMTIPEAIAVPDSMWAIPVTKYRIEDYVRDTAQQTKVVKAEVQPRKSKKKQELQLPDTVQNTTGIDTTAPVFFSGYHHVKIFSDSMQALCDSVCFTRSDSVVRMIYNPIAWSRGSQITGDTILMQLDSSSVRCMYVPDNSFVVSRSGPEQAQLYDQVQGKTLTAFFRDNAVQKMIVTPDAESIYFSKDDAGAYLGVNEAKSVLMHVYFGEQNISKIKFVKDVQQTMSPLDKVDIPNLRLSRYKWLYDNRPKSKAELFE